MLFVVLFGNFLHYVEFMNQNQATKLISKDKFGYSLETFRSSALASLETKPSHKENSKNIRQTNERLFGSMLSILLKILAVSRTLPLRWCARAAAKASETASFSSSVGSWLWRSSVDVMAFGSLLKGLFYLNNIFIKSGQHLRCVTQNGYGFFCSPAHWWTRVPLSTFPIASSGFGNCLVFNSEFCITRIFYF